MFMSVLITVENRGLANSNYGSTTGFETMVTLCILPSTNTLSISPTNTTASLLTVKENNCCTEL